MRVLVGAVTSYDIFDFLELRRTRSYCYCCTVPLPELRGTLFDGHDIEYPYLAPTPTVVLAGRMAYSMLRSSGRKDRRIAKSYSTVVKAGLLVLRTKRTCRARQTAVIMPRFRVYLCI